MDGQQHHGTTSDVYRAPRRGSHHGFDYRLQWNGWDQAWFGRAEPVAQCPSDASLRRHELVIPVTESTAAVADGGSHSVCWNPRIDHRADDVAVRGVRPHQRIIHQPRPARVEVDVPDGSDEVRVVRDQARRLHRTPHPLLPGVLRKRCCDPRETLSLLLCISAREQEVQVTRHQEGGSCNPSTLCCGGIPCQGGICTE
jgi:hypothetical protein